LNQAKNLSDSLAALKGHTNRDFFYYIIQKGKGDMITRQIGGYLESRKLRSFAKKK